MAIGVAFGDFSQEVLEVSWADWMLDHRDEFFLNYCCWRQTRGRWDGGLDAEVLAQANEWEKGGLNDRQPFSGRAFLRRFRQTKLRCLQKDNRVQIVSFLGYEFDPRRSLMFFALAVLISIPLWLVLSLTMGELRFSSVVWISIIFALLGLFREARTDEDGLLTRLVFEAVVSGAIAMFVSFALRAAGI
ncbi:hypothetical protein [Sinorhizobium meliloti]|uniref:hypothetical protein n=1 Tax=Rhizobium meliloti TaxID=382 RepID=UPI0018E28934|nr:hypothetical protein [Sinorhizobium meliloti]